jgi:uncharacterized protein YbaA (DUF1428 family)
MSQYIDGYVIPVPRDNIDAYLRLEAEAWEIWHDHGALRLVACIGDDVPPGKLTSFPQSLDLKDDEVVALAWIVYESREQRDRVNAAVMQDPRMANIDPASMPFDGARMYFGGFSMMLDLPAQ